MMAKCVDDRNKKKRLMSKMMNDYKKGLFVMNSLAVVFTVLLLHYLRNLEPRRRIRLVFCLNRHI